MVSLTYAPGRETPDYERHGSCQLSVLSIKPHVIQSAAKDLCTCLREQGTNAGSMLTSRWVCWELTA